MERKRFQIGGRNGKQKARHENRKNEDRRTIECLKEGVGGMNVSVDSRSPSKSERGSPANAKSDSRSGSASPSRASKRSESRSRSRSKSRSHSRRHSNRRYSRSRSHSRKKSRSRSYSPEYRRRKSQSTSPMSNRRRHAGSRGSHGHGKQDKYSGAATGGGMSAGCDELRQKQANPDPNTCLGVFGLSLYTTERDLREVFSRHGPLAGVNVVYDQRTGRSRGFAFVYYERIDDAKEAMERANGMELDGRRIRVDYSITKRPHTPTPGIYMGRPTHNGGGGGGGGSSSSSSGGRRRDDRGGGYDRGYDRGGDRGYDRGGDRGYDRYDDRRRSPSPYYSRYRSRSRSRSYSPRRY
ncbi:transformer-2 protein homolog alpha isoform X2 [Alosa sapidissima]|uniref:transformer-2 protein homolog alpha isoform X2 n=1 Tax=Alosa sapidissima TaxID=34773 RepID=UPI001C088700|nr:transformer-2 protein homolog alpha isoform X2 [Alosa sapidissima]